jgi:hypothetical protein
MVRDDVRDSHVASKGHCVTNGALINSPSLRRNHLPNGANGMSCEAQRLQDGGVDEWVATAIC